MGLVQVMAGIAGPGQDPTQVEFLVDTGSFYTAISRDLSEKLQLSPGMPGQVMVADGRVLDTEVTIARIKINGRQAIVPVEVGDAPVPLLGASALEALGMKVNPVTQELEEVWPFDAPPRMWRPLRE